MNPQDKHPGDWQSLRQKIIGLGEKSIRKSYYPELRQRLTDFENFYALMNHVSDAILLFDVDTHRITDANRAACALLQHVTYTTQMCAIYATRGVGFAICDIW